MEKETSLILELALCRGLITQAQAEALRENLSSGDDPLESLVRDRQIDPSDADQIRGFLQRFNEDRKLTRSLVEEKLLSGESASYLHRSQVESIGSGKMISLSEAARTLPSPVADHAMQRMIASASASDGSDSVLLGRYKVLERVGEGGAGEVFRGIDLQLDRVVAIKKTSGQDRIRFLREAQSTARLHHPNIVPVYDMGEEGRFNYLILKFVEGRTLGKWLENHRVGFRDVARVLMEACRGIQHAHEHKILHRDVKPENILVDSESRALVTDFGLAREMGDTTRLTVDGMVMGTPSYMSPEQASGRIRDVDERSDVYSMGATLYFGLTRSAPALGDTVQQVLEQVQYREPDIPRVRDPQIPLDLETVCLKALEKDKSRRYGTMKALADDLERFLSGEGILARPPSLGYRIRKGIRRRKMALGVIALASLIGVFSFWGISKISRAEKRVEESSESTFRDASEKAAAAFQKERWNVALFESQRGLAIRTDGPLRKIRDHARGQLDRQIHRGELESALKPLERKIVDARPHFYIKDIDIWEKLKPVETAVQKLSEMMARPRYSEFAEGWNALGRGLYFVGRPDRAVSYLERALELRPEDDETRMIVAEILLCQAMEIQVSNEGEWSKSPLEKAREKAGRANELVSGVSQNARVDQLQLDLLRAHLIWLTEGDQAGKDACRKGIERFGKALGTEQFWILLAFISHNESSLQHLTYALDRKPQDSWALWLRGHLYSDSGRLDLALSDLDAAIRIRPGFKSAYVNRGVTLYRMGNLPGALKAFEKVVELFPGEAQGWMKRGAIRVQMGKIDEALADLTKAIRIEPRLPEPWNTRGTIQDRRGDKLAAIEDYSEAIRVDSNYSRAYYNRANMYLSLGKLDAALDDYDQAVRTDPNHLDSYNNRGWVRSKLGDREGAIRDYSEALRRDPKYTDALINRGREFLLMGDLRGAVEDYSEAIRIDPKLPLPYYNRGLAKRSLGDLAWARRDFKRALEVAPVDWPSRPAVLKDLESISESP